MSKTSTQLLQERQELFKQAEGLLELIEKEERKFSEDEGKEFESLQNDIEELTSHIERITWREAGLRPVKGVSSPSEADDRREFEQRKRSFEPKDDEPLTSRQWNGALRAWMFPGRATDEERHNAARIGWVPGSQEISMRFHRGWDPSGAPLHFPKDMREWEKQCEYRAQNPPERRAMEAGTTTQGLEWVPDTAMAALDKALLEFGGMRQVARVVSTATGSAFPVPIVDDTGNSGTVRAESAASTETDVTTSQIVLGAFTIDSDIVRVTFEMFQDSEFDMGTVLLDLLGERVARRENSEFTVGVGGAANAQGIVEATGTDGVDNSNITLATNSTVTYNNLVDIMHSVDPAWRMGGGTWMFNDTMLSRAERITGADGQPLWQPNVQEGTPMRLLGFPIQINQDMLSTASSRCIVFGNIRRAYWIREVAGFELRRTEHRYFENRQVGFLGTIRSDGDVIQPAAAKFATNAV